MAESVVPTNTTTETATKSVLVCVGERKREVSFSYQGSYVDEMKALGVAGGKFTQMC